MIARRWLFALVAICAVVPFTAGVASASGSGTSGGGGGGGGGVTTTTIPKTDTIKVTKCYINSGGAMLIKAASSDPSARLFAYRPNGTLIGEVQNGGGSRYGGTVMPWQAYDPVTVTVRSTSGGSVNVATSPFQI